MIDDQSEILRASKRIAMMDIIVGALLLTYVLWLGSTSLETLSWKLVAGLLFGAPFLVWLIEPLVSGLSRRETKDLSRKMRPRWWRPVYWGIFAVFAILTFPGMPKGMIPFMPNAGVGLGIGVAIGTTMTLAGIYNFFWSSDKGNGADVKDRKSVV